jgi:hypothetical protein
MVEYFELEVRVACRNSTTDNVVCKPSRLHRAVIFLEVAPEHWKAQSTYDFSVKTEKMQLRRPFYILTS